MAVGANWPTTLRVTLGSLWTGRFGLSPGTIIDLQQESVSTGAIYYSEDGTANFNKSTNRLRLVFWSNANRGPTYTHYPAPTYSPAYGRNSVEVAMGKSGQFSPTYFFIAWRPRQKKYTFNFPINGYSTYDNYNFKDLFTNSTTLGGSGVNGSITHNRYWTQWGTTTPTASADSGFNFKYSPTSNPTYFDDLFSAMEAAPTGGPSANSAGAATGTGQGEASSDKDVPAQAASSGTGHAEASSTKGAIAQAEGTGTGHGEAAIGISADNKGTGTGHGEAESAKGTVAGAEGGGSGHAEAAAAGGHTGAGDGTGTGHAEATAAGEHTGAGEGSGTGHTEAVAAGGHIGSGEGSGSGHTEATSTKGVIANAEGAGTGHAESVNDVNVQTQNKGTGTGHGEAESIPGHTGNPEGTGTGSGFAVAGGAVPGGSRSLGRDQIPFGAKSNFPFVKPSDDIKRILGDFYLTYEDPDCRYALPLRVAWMSGFGTTPVPNFPGRPAPVHQYDLIVEDGNGLTVFDSTQADDFVTVEFGGRLESIEWKTADAVCRATRHTKAEIGDPPLIFDEFIEPEESELDQITYRAMPRRVRAFRVGLVRVAAENVIWDEGFNVSMTPGDVVSQDGGRRVQPLVMTANPGDGNGRVPACEDVDPAIRKINSVQPDQAGNFLLDAAQCYRIQRPTRLTNIDPREVEFYANGLTSEEAAAALQIANDCGPCCECDDFINTYEGLRRLEDRYFRLGRRAEAARDLYAQNLARWQNARDCFLATPMRLVVRQDFSCVIGVGLNFCNLTGECINGVELRLTLESFRNGAPDPQPSAVVTICPETAINGTDTNYEDRTIDLAGAFPAYSTFLDLADPQATQKLRTYFWIPGCAISQTVCITATAHFESDTVPAVELDSAITTAWADAGIDTTVPARGVLKKCAAITPLPRCR